MKDEPNVLELRFWSCMKAEKWWRINGIVLMGEISMGPFMKTVSTDVIIHTWSTDRDPSIAHQDNLKAFVQAPAADTTPLLDSAWKWPLLAKNIISKGNKHYFASGLSKKNDLQPADITTYESALKKTSWKSFVFIRGINMCRVVTLNNQDFRHS
ncbi:hypothetical protein BpHYR1_052737 [Brachionus plicatilis]|uniref:Uncharacterized protein n=1 Tax=Brachionus plicatilis TaxID=10195 RepID=A0A3M7PWN0_BRAPC|nr:hypothetical protein BpHYR1_052737 [Brachionus plicatilis]